MNVKLSIIIVNFRVKEKLLKCIESIYASKPKTSFEIVVVNNGEEDGIKEALKKMFPKTVYIKSPKNLGYGGGNNLGASVAKGEYLFILNPDTLVFKNTLDELVDFLSKDEAVGIAVPMLVDSNNTPFRLQGTGELTPLRGIVCLSFIEKLLPNNSWSKKYWLKNWDHQKLQEVEVTPGTAFMISKKLFTEIGGFDKDFFLYFEEDDLSKRVRTLGKKIFILEKSKIFHEVGASTKQLVNSSQIFAKSRFTYFKKHYGIFKALMVEAFLRINKMSLFLMLIIGIAYFLRAFNIENGMPFIGDQGWFYLSAKDLLVHGQIPLVGITSSHTWLHQGPLWTYMLSFALFLGKFNPVSGAYLTIAYGVVTTLLMYRLGQEMFSRKVGIISALLYASSPLIISFDRMPFDPSIIPFFAVLYLFALVKWVKGNIKFFPIILLLLAILYNLELATFTLVIPFVLIITYGLFKKYNWARGVFNRKTISLSLILPLMIMLPVLTYDLSNGFKQTIVFVGWTIYKSFSFLFHHSSGNLLDNLKTVADFGLLNLQRLIFQESLLIAVLLFVLGICVLFVQVSKNRQLNIPRLVLLLLLLISLLGIVVNQTPSDAYLPIVLPFIIFTVAIVFEQLLKIKSLKYFTIPLLVLIILTNSYAAFKNDLTSDLSNRIEVADRIIKVASGEEYNLIRKGIGSEFRSSTMNYEYLLWLKGYPVAEKSVKSKIVVWQLSKEIIIYKQQ